MSQLAEKIAEVVEGEAGAARLTGVLLRIRPEGYGFIHTAQSDFYVNINAMRERKAWKEGTLVSFVPGKPKKGKATPAYQVERMRKAEV